jgi:xylulokinase
VWPQIVSDVTGLEQVVPAETIGAAYGDALLAAIAAGVVAPETDWARPARTIEPDPSSTELYDELFELYKQLYEATAPVSHRLARLQRTIEELTPIG